MAITISGTDGIVGAGFTVDNSGVSVTAGVGTFSSIQGSGANLTALPAANLTGSLPALSAASLTQIPAANIVGVCTSGLSDASGVLAGVTVIDQWRITSSFATNSDYITANWERTDNPASTILLSGGGMTESSGVFTFPSTGIYLIHAMTRGYRSSQVSYAGIQIEPTINNSGYANMADGFSSVGQSNYYFHASAQLVFDVSDTSTHKIKIKVAADGSTNFSGDSSVQMTGATFIRLGDT